MTFDLSISFDTTEYLTPQIYLLVDTLKKNLPEDTLLHVTTNRSDNDSVLKFIKSNIYSRIYKKAPLHILKSRCSYLMHSFEIKTNADWVIKMDIDIFALKHLKEFEKILKPRSDIVIPPENRRIIKNDNLEGRIWRTIYNRLNVKLPEWKMTFVENGEEGMPLFNTGIIAVRSEYLDDINRHWIPMTQMAEDWIQYGVHPNEFAMTALIEYMGWKWKYLHKSFNWNPIGNCRKGEFPSIELQENCKIPKSVSLLHYHKPQWLNHLCKSNPRIKGIVERNKKYIPSDWWNLPIKQFIERI